MGRHVNKTPKQGKRPSGGTRKSRMVLAASVAESPAHRHKLQGFCDYAAKAGWNVETVVNIGALGQSITSPDELDIYDGFVIDFWPLYHIIDPLRLRRPVVAVDRSFDDACGIDTVSCDSRAVGVTAAQELLGRDPASISFVAPALDWHFFKARKESFVSTVEAAGREVLVWSIGDKDDRLAERRRLAAWLRSLPKPCAVFAPNDVVAVAVFSAARLASLRMPQDVAILGVDNDELLCGSCLPSLSSVMVDFENAGRIAARLLDARMADADAGSKRGPDRHENYGVLGIASRGSTRVAREDEASAPFRRSPSTTSSTRCTCTSRTRSRTRGWQPALSASGAPTSRRAETARSCARRWPPCATSSCATTRKSTWASSAPSPGRRARRRIFATAPSLVFKPDVGGAIDLDELA